MVTDPVRTNATPCPTPASSPIDSVSQSRNARPILTRLPIRKPNIERNTARLSGPGRIAVKQSDATRIDLNRWNPGSTAAQVIEHSGERGDVDPDENRTDGQMHSKPGADFSGDVATRTHRPDGARQQAGKRYEHKAPMDDDACDRAQGGGE